MILNFDDGQSFDTSGEIRKEKRGYSWYVLGKGMFIPCVDEQDADEVVSLLAHPEPKRGEADNE